ncbi:hypothetical protein [Actomonas aquatica]|uniref:Uncharacterized protein n=1 Tax=Actomonas aquatica TaxID=2866162 RepID=A0ABZ1CCI8_9BACT|nr:hypothetical protein [Opitutus sp. WL0086]WRQ89384.1 hypothetical protein K1X11_008180 [Opitutus sp. WL0086]
MSDADRILRLESELESLMRDHGSRLATLEGTLKVLQEQVVKLEERVYSHQGQVAEVERLREDLRSLRQTLDRLLLGSPPLPPLPRD